MKYHPSTDVCSLLPVHPARLRPRPAAKPGDHVGRSYQEDDGGKVRNYSCRCRWGTDAMAGRLYALSMHEKELTIEVWERAKAFDERRKARLGAI